MDLLLLLIFVVGLSEPKAQVRFPDRYSSIVRRRRCDKLFIFLSSKTTRPISTKLGTKHYWLKGIQDCSSEGPRPFPKGDNYEMAKIH